MGILDRLFGKKVTVVFDDGTGKKVSRSVSAADLKAWQEQGKVGILPTVQVHVLDPMGDHTTTWQVGRDVQPDIVQKARDPETGDLYAIRFYEAGVAQTYVTTKQKWLIAKGVVF